MRLALLALVALVTTSATAHIVPVPPSTCAFDPVSVEMPAVALAVPATPAGTADAFRVLYDPTASTAQFDLRTVPPRHFAGAGVDGTLALSSLFVGALRAGGDLTAAPDFTFATGGDPVTVPVALTTGLARAGGVIVEGAPLGGDGRFTVVGVIDPSPLAPPLAGGPLAVRLGCQATPPPDTDQFRSATRTTPVSASLKASLLKLKLIFAPGAMDQPDFARRVAMLRASSGGATVATVVVPALTARGRKLFVGQSDDGTAALGVRALRRNGQVAYLLALKVQRPSMPGAVGGPVQVGIVYDVGGLLSRTTLNMRPKRRGAVLRFP